MAPSWAPYLALIALLASLFAPTPTFSQDVSSCGRVLDTGLFNQYSRRQSETAAAQSQQAACQDFSLYTYSQYQQEKSGPTLSTRANAFNQAASFVYTYGGNSVGATSSGAAAILHDEYAFNQAKAAIVAYRAVACSASGSTTASNNTLEVLQRTVDPVIFSAYMRCLEMSQKGLLMTTSFGAGGNSVDLSFQFTAVQAGAKAFLVDVVAYPAEGATCTLHVSQQNQAVMRSAAVVTSAVTGAAVHKEDVIGSTAGNQDGVGNGGRHLSQLYERRPPPRPPLPVRKPPSPRPPPPAPPAPPPGNPFDVELKPLVWYTVHCEIKPEVLGTLLDGDRDVVDISVLTTVASAFKTKLYTTPPPTAEEYFIEETIAAVQAQLDTAKSAFSADISAIVSSLANITTRMIALNISFNGQLNSQLAVRDLAINSSLASLRNQLAAQVDRIDNLESRLTSVNNALDTKINTVNTGLDSKIKGLDSRVTSTNTALDTKINSVNTALDTKINSVNTALTTRIQNLELQLAGLQVNRNALLARVGILGNQDVTITVHNGWWGNWQGVKFCTRRGPDGLLRGMPFNGYRMRVESSCGNCDDTALNGLLMMCTGSPVTVPIVDGYWGSWGSVPYCSAGSHIIGARLKVEGQQSGDDTAANSIQFRCSNGQDIEANNPGPWGSWSDWAICPTGTFVCGVEARWEGDQGGNNDDTAFNGLRLTCCAPWP